jgi:hypothetical protein
MVLAAIPFFVLLITPQLKVSESRLYSTGVPYNPTTLVFRGARRDMCTRKTRALQHCHFDMKCVCVHFSPQKSTQ